MKKLSIVIPTFNRIAKLTRLLDSIYESNISQNDLEIIVVDNLSTDSTADTLTKKYSGVKVLQPGENLYSAGGRDYGAAKSNGKYIAFIDDDNILTKDCLRNIVSAMDDDEKIGICGPVMCFYNNQNIIWSAGGIISKYGVVTHYLGKEDLEEIDSKKNIEVDYIPNMYVIRKSLISLGLKHDTRLFPHNWAEQDYCIKVKRLGYKVTTITNSIEYHDIDYTRKITRLGIDKTYDQARARIVFRRLYVRGLASFFYFWFVIFPGSTLYYIRAFILDKDNSALLLTNAYVKGTLTGVRQRL